MDSRTGKKIRLGRLFNQVSGKSLIVAYSHGVLLGPQPGMASLEEMRQMCQSLAGADGLMVTPGLLSALEEAFIGRHRPSLVVHMDYQSFSRSILPYSEGATTPMAQIEEVVVAGADAVMTYLYLGYQAPEREKMEIDRNARLARACDHWGLGMMIEPRSAREATHPEDKTDTEIMALYCRISAEIGADVVKCIYPGDPESLAKILHGCPVPVLVAGGKKTDIVEDTYQQAREAMQAGASGLVFGRKIYQSDDPAAVLARLLEIVHGKPQ